MECVPFDIRYQNQLCGVTSAEENAGSANETIMLDATRDELFKSPYRSSDAEQ